MRRRKPVNRLVEKAVRMLRTGRVESMGGGRFNVIGDRHLQRGPGARREGLVHLPRLQGEEDLLPLHGCPDDKP